jgi:plastocyanin
MMSSAVLAAMTMACGDSGGSDPPPGEDPLVVQRTAVSSGNGQTGVVGDLLPAELRVVITRTSEPQEGVAVAWATADGGTLAPPSSDTDADGIATTTWTLGAVPGTQTATATVAGASGSPLSFTATAEDDTPPPPPASATIQVLGPSGGNRFSPTEVTIQAGQTVKWSWPNGSQLHNVEPDPAGGEPVRSGGLVSGPMEYSFTFTTAGTYDFYCANHGGLNGFGMSGTVIVQP